MEITRIQRQQAEERANEVQLRLYGEPEAGEQLWNIATKYGLTERRTYYTFSQLVGDVVLGFYKENDIAALIASKLPQIQGVQRIGLEADIKVFLYPLHEATPAPAPASTPPVSLSEIAETEQALAHMKGLRTMAHDVKEAQTHGAAPHPQLSEEPVYQSTQSDLLRGRKANLADTPHWETDN